ncbi:hypothetical protein [Glacieibacterium sp.]|uniref:hypothetical protein n=1 Tax=Glacieibacterium sp. TaxID=2860237 RepID=UPI003AFF9FC3
MNMKLTALVAAVISVGVAVPAAAAVNARQLNQERNIDAGLRSGKLTRGEARTLKSEIRAIEFQKAKFERDGHYTKREKAIIHRRQDAVAHRMDRLKSNGRRG